MTKKRPDKSRTWEKERRDRLNKSFEKLAKLLPQYDPTVIWSKVEILQRSIAHIDDIHKKHEEFLKTKDPEGLKQYKDLLDAIKYYQERNGQLSDLLKKAKISLPPFKLPKFIAENSTLKSDVNNLNKIQVKPVGRPPKYSNKIFPKDTESGKEKTIESKNSKKSTEDRNDDKNANEETNEGNEVPNSNQIGKTKVNILEVQTIVPALNDASSVMPVNQAKIITSSVVTPPTAILQPGILVPVVPAILATRSLPHSMNNPAIPLLNITNITNSKQKVIKASIKLRNNKISKGKDGLAHIFPRPEVKIYYRRPDGKIPIPVLRKTVNPSHKPKRKRKRKLQFGASIKRNKKSKTCTTNTAEACPTEVENKKIEETKSENISKEILMPDVITQRNDSALHIPSTKSDSGSVSPTAAFLMSFPVVSGSSGKMNDISGNEDKRESSNDNLENLNNFFNTKEYEKYCKRFRENIKSCDVKKDAPTTTCQHSIAETHSKISMNENSIKVTSPMKIENNVVPSPKISNITTAITTKSIIHKSTSNISRTTTLSTISAPSLNTFSPISLPENYPSVSKVNERHQWNTAIPLFSFDSNNKSCTSLSTPSKTTSCQFSSSVVSSNFSFPNKISSSIPICTPLPLQENYNNSKSGPPEILTAVSAVNSTTKSFSSSVTSHLTNSNWLNYPIHETAVSNLKENYSTTETEASNLPTYTYSTCRLSSSTTNSSSNYTTFPSYTTSKDSLQSGSYFTKEKSKHKDKNTFRQNENPIVSDTLMNSIKTLSTTTKSTSNKILESTTTSCYSSSIASKYLYQNSLHNLSSTTSASTTFSNLYTHLGTSTLSPSVLPKTSTINSSALDVNFTTSSCKASQGLLSYPPLTPERPWLPSYTDYKSSFTFSLTPTTTTYPKMKENQVGRPLISSSSTNLITSSSCKMEQDNKMKFTTPSIVGNSNQIDTFTFSLTTTENTSRTTIADSNKNINKIVSSSSKDPISSNSLNVPLLSASYGKHKENIKFPQSSMKSTAKPNIISSSSKTANNFTIDSTLGTKSSQNCQQNSTKSFSNSKQENKSFSTSSIPKLGNFPLQSAPNEHTSSYENSLGKLPVTKPLEQKSHINWMTSTSNATTNSTSSYNQSSEIHCGTVPPRVLSDSIYPFSSGDDNIHHSWSPSKIFESSAHFGHNSSQNYYCDFSYHTPAPCYSTINNEGILLSSFEQQNQKENSSTSSNANYNKTATYNSSTNFFSVSQLVQQEVPEVSSRNYDTYSEKVTPMKSKNHSQKSGHQNSYKPNNHHLSQSQQHQSVVNQQNVSYNNTMNTCNVNTSINKSSTISNSYSTEALLSKKEKHKTVNCTQPTTNIGSVATSNASDYYVPSTFDPNCNVIGYNSLDSIDHHHHHHSQYQNTNYNNYFYPNYSGNQNFTHDIDYLGASSTFSNSNQYLKTSSKQNKKSSNLVANSSNNTTVSSINVPSSSSAPINPPHFHAPTLPPPVPPAPTPSTNFLTYDSNYFSVPPPPPPPPPPPSSNLGINSSISSSSTTPSLITPSIAVTESSIYENHAHYNIFSTPVNSIEMYQNNNHCWNSKVPPPPPPPVPSHPPPPATPFPPMQSYNQSQPHHHSQQHQQQQQLSQSYHHHHQQIQHGIYSQLNSSSSHGHSSSSGSTSNNISHQQQQSSAGSTNNLTNFNLSSICPEINETVRPGW